MRHPPAIKHSDSVRVTYNGTLLKIELVEQERVIELSKALTKFDLVKILANEIEESWRQGVLDGLSIAARESK